MQDQLRREKDAGRIFRNFREAPIAFSPTYKVPHDPLSCGTVSCSGYQAYVVSVLWCLVA